MLKTVFFTLLSAILFFGLDPAKTQAQSKVYEFSFLVFGSTRHDHYLPGGVDGADGMKEVLAGGQKPGKSVPRLYFEPTGTELVRVEEYDEGKEKMSVYSGGWPLRTLVREDNRWRSIMRREGREFVFSGVLLDLKTDSAFAIHLGDMILDGRQGLGLMKNPHWRKFDDDFLSKLPQPSLESGLPSRLFYTLGEHEVKADPGLEGVLGSLPDLSVTGFSSERRMYSFTYGGCRFIVLDTGGDDCGEDGWCGAHPYFKSQMDSLRLWLEMSEAEKANQVFVFFHKPVFTLAKKGKPLRPDQSPQSILAEFGSKLDITVFSGHPHTTEAFLDANVKYLNIGGGGAVQDLELDLERKGLPAEIYWKGSARVEEYSYLKVQIGNRGPVYSLRRFRPGEPKRPLDNVTIEFAGKKPYPNPQEVPLPPLPK